MIMAKPNEFHPEVDIERMLRYARAACAREGFSSYDSEYGSAIGAAVWRAAQRWQPRDEGQPSLPPHRVAARWALDACRAVHKSLVRRQQLENQSSESIPETTIASESEDLTLDRELLLFVKLRGLSRAATELGIAAVSLIERLDEAKERIRLASRSRDC
jgi:hypothetical protein